MTLKCFAALAITTAVGCTSPQPRPIETVVPATTPVNASSPDSEEWTGFTDPMVVRGRDGKYYAFASQTKTDTGFINIQVARSPDLKAWEELRDALPLKPEWADQTQGLRSPHVVELDGVALMYYSAKPNPGTVNTARGGTCMNVAFAEGALEGPYMDQGFPLHCVPGAVNMSPMAFDDPVTGKLWLYWSSGSRFIARELRSTRVQFDPGADAIDLVVPPTARTTPDSSFLVGIWVTYRQPYYYLFYSRRDCCSPSAENSILVARSRSATGPFEGRGAGGASEVVLVAPRGAWSRVGQISIVRELDGQDWLVYDVVDLRGPQPVVSGVVNRARTIVNDLLVYLDGWPGVFGSH
jgi:arabinan endo-1,5-alpha-L-arabinosidase